MKCPGQDSRYWEETAIFEVPCPKCGSPIEFFKDDPSRTCRGCGSRQPNPRIDFGCAAYCPHASQCLGSLPEGGAGGSRQTLKERAAIAMKRHLGTDFKRIGHAAKVAHYAEEISRSEPGGDPAVILIAAYLHDLGRPDGGALARDILAGLQADTALIAAVCELIAPQPGLETAAAANFKVFHDAERIAHLEAGEQQSPLDREKLGAIIEQSLRTETGRRIAAEVLLNNQECHD